jgi:hypothetical protein
MQRRGPLRRHIAAKEEPSLPRTNLVRNMYTARRYRCPPSSTSEAAGGEGKPPIPPPESMSPFFTVARGTGVDKARTISLLTASKLLLLISSAKFNQIYTRAGKFISPIAVFLPHHVLPGRATFCRLAGNRARHPWHRFRAQNCQKLKKISCD